MVYYCSKLYSGFEVSIGAMTTSSVRVWSNLRGGSGAGALEGTLKGATIAYGS
jgi:hypothetical protein